ncbi:hypothetical protein TNCT_174001 [Trichonephila clavata]|uniref:Uncharacterized protein n=1 Tax=Trichonephila clavata TaxID=2740835 RepID=A0A8X6GVT3_TRICU|nr:hypothetical protein TNCT_174001 [Trichonephila clavata]
MYCVIEHTAHFSLTTVHCRTFAKIFDTIIISAKSWISNLALNLSFCRGVTLLDGAICLGEQNTLSVQQCIRIIYKRQILWSLWGVYNGPFLNRKSSGKSQERFTHRNHKRMGSYFQRHRKN